MEIIGAGFGILGTLVIIVAVVILLLVVRGSGKANEVAGQQDRELEREMEDAAAWERITSR